MLQPSESVAYLTLDVEIIGRDERDPFAYHTVFYLYHGLSSIYAAALHPFMLSSIYSMRSLSSIYFVRFHAGFPIVTFVDTPGAFAGRNAEELGQGEAIAVNLREMFGFRVPIISVVIGEGGSGAHCSILYARIVLMLLF